MKTSNNEAFYWFTRRFSDINLEPVWLNKRAFLMSDTLKEFANKYTQPIESAGRYLGKVKGKKFEPSVTLIDVLSKSSDKKLVINKNAEWLFLCGRDLFTSSILSFTPPIKKGSWMLIQNDQDENLGYGEVNASLTFGKKDVVGNLLDRGDFLRREK
jgi:ribosome biogenesis protein Nip4